ncbi:MAG: hypothetical protein OHK0046_20340 [Anaerolineae bacterium]
MSNHERKLLMYLSALDAGDADTLSAILREAEDDPQLSQMISELHDHYTLEDPARLNGHLNGHHAGAVIALPVVSIAPAVQAQPETRPLRRPQSALVTWMVTAAAMLMMLMLGLGIVTQSGDPDSATVIPADLEPITAENAAELTRLATLGEGAITGMVWKPDSSALTLGTTSGIFNYAAGKLTPFGGQNEGASSLHYAANGTRLIGQREGDIWVWEAMTGEVLQRVDVSEMVADEWYSLYVRTDGTQAATMACTETPDNGIGCDVYQVVIWDLANGEVISTIDGLPYTLYVSFAPDFQWLAYSSTVNNRVYLVNVADPEYRAEDLPVGRLIARNSRIPFFTPDGEALLLISPITNFLPERIPVEDLESAVIEDESRERLASAQYGPQRFLSLSQDGVRLARSGPENVNVVAVTDTDNLDVDIMLENYSVNGLTLSPDGRTLALEQYGGYIDLWDVEQGEQIDTILDFGPYYSNVFFSPDGNAVLGNSWSSPIFSWDISGEIPTESLITGANGELNIQQAALSPDGTLLGYLRANVLDIGVYDRVNMDYLQAEPQLARAETFTFNMENDIIVANYDATLIRWDGAEQTTIALDDQQGRPTLTTRLGLALSPDGRLFAAAFLTDTSRSAQQSDGEMRLNIWDTATGRLLLSFNVSDETNDTHGIWSHMKFDPTGQFLAQSTCVEVVETINNGVTYSRCAAHTFQLWDTRAALERLDDPTLEPQIGDEPLTLFSDEGFPTQAIAFSPNSTPENILMAVAVYEQEESALQLWQIDLVNRESTLVQSWDERALAWSPGSMAFNAEGTLLAIGRDGVIDLWGVEG